MSLLQSIRDKKAKKVLELKQKNEEIELLSDPEKQKELAKEQAELKEIEEKIKLVNEKATKLKASVESKDEDTEEEKKQKQKEYDDALKKADSILNN